MAFQSVSKDDKDVCPEYGRQDYQSDDKLFSEYDQKNKDYRNKHGIAGFGMSRPLPCEPDLVYRGAKVKKDCAQCVHCSRCRTPQPQLLHGVFPVIRSICYLSSICAPYREYRKPWKDTGNVFPRLFDDRGPERVSLLPFDIYSIASRYRHNPNPVSDRSKMASGICLRYFRPKLVVPKCASKLATGSTTQSESSGLLAR